MINVYFVSTPIGNLKDISLRALEVLKACDYVACEDTRHTQILLNEYEIKSKLIAYHKHNEQVSSDGIVKLALSGKTIAVVSDAGMPVINDPGNILVNKLIENGIEFTIIPGANAALCALVLSGFCATKFAFFGFLSEKLKEKEKQLEDISNFKGTRIIYSSKYNVNDDLKSLHEILGNEKVCVVSEISKFHEKTQFLSLSDANIEEPKGEFVIVIDYHNEKPNVVDDNVLIEEVQKLVGQNMRKNDAIKKVCEKFDKPRNYVYNLLVKRD